MKPSPDRPLAFLAGTAYRNRSNTARIIARQLLASLRRDQSCGMSLKKAVQHGLVKIVYSDEPDPRLRTARVVPR